MSSNVNSNIDWNDTIKKEAEGINGEDFGEVQDVSNGFVLVQKGIINKERFLIPQELVESYDGDILRFRVSEGDIQNKYLEGSSSEATNTEQVDIRPTKEETEETIPLTEERLNISKDVHEQHATITKEPITETKTVEVPVTHEEISIERRTPSDGEGQVASQGPVTSSEEISIPLKKEEVDVSKTPYVKEEVTVKKKPVTETREVTEQVTSERISTDSSP
jgi:uncharacterized protein (TIGR02271 family)